MVSSKSKPSLPSESATGGSAKKKQLSAQERRLHRLGLVEPSDFIVHLPLRYEDETRILPIHSLRAGDTAQLEGTVSDVAVQYRPRRQLTARLSDGSGTVSLRWLHFYPSQIRQLESGRPLRVRGDVRAGFHGLELVHPRLSVTGTPLPDTLTPVYPSVDGLTQKVLRAAIVKALQIADLSDTLPDAIRDRWQLVPFKQAIHRLHHPTHDMLAAESLSPNNPALVRIKFDELLAQQLSLAAARAARRREQSIPLKDSHSALVHELLTGLPFALTNAQQRAIQQISDDLCKPYPMHRLLQGDVGSGKTIVAAAAALQAISSGSQAAIMAPTEILAQQHHENIGQWLAPLGIETVWLAGSMPTKDRRSSLERIVSGQAQLVVGTQALIQEHVAFFRLGLVILDEQHRFGVGQRLELTRKGDDGRGYTPHQLNMSATPIPRTLAMTYLADLDVSVLDELPPGRKPVLTKLVNDSRRNEIIEHIRTEIQAGRQVYWVCPLVEESDALQLQTAVDTHQFLDEVFTDFQVGLLHGRLSTEEKQQVMQAFHEGRIQLLVATTVIEVGVDVPNASLMIIEHAERFGLAQLHQLRGRVGRGSQSSVCVLLYQTPLSAVGRQRLQAMYETTDGFEIARRDLTIRGPGEFLGTRQSGQLPLRFADTEADAELIEDAREAAQLLLEQYPDHAQRHVARWMKNRHEFLRS